MIMLPEMVADTSHAFIANVAKVCATRTSHVVATVTFDYPNNRNVE